MLKLKTLLIILSLALMVKSKLAIDSTVVENLEKELDRLLEQTILSNLENPDLNSKLSVDPFESFSTFDGEIFSQGSRPIEGSSEPFTSFPDKSSKLSPGLDSRTRPGRSTCAGGGVGMY
jgi:hypothetical protein